jgi:hypothetical protein
VTKLAKSGEGGARPVLDMKAAKLVDLQVNFEAQPVPVVAGEIAWATVDLVYSAHGLGAEMTLRVPVEWDGSTSEEARKADVLRKARDLLDHACNAPGLARAARGAAPENSIEDVGPFEGLAQELGLVEPTRKPIRGL